MDQVILTVRHHGKTSQYRVRKGLGLQAVSLKESLPIEYDCRKADCGICIVRVLKGIENLSDKTDSERDFLKAMFAEDCERLSCQVRLMGDVEIEVETF